MAMGYGWCMMLCADVLLKCCLIMRVLLMRTRNRELMQCNHDLKDNVEDYRRELKNRAEVHEEVKIVRHDFIHHINEIERLAYCGSRNQVLHYLEGVRELMEDTRKINVTEYAGRSSVIDIFIARARRTGAAVTCDIQLPPDWDYENREFNTVMGNLFENALRAVRDMTGVHDIPVHSADHGEQNAIGEKPWIDVKIFHYKGALYVFVKNSYTGVVVKGDMGFMTTKTDSIDSCHGLGLKSVRKIVKAHGGAIDVNAENGVFSVSIMMYM